MYNRHSPHFKYFSEYCNFVALKYTTGWRQGENLEFPSCYQKPEDEDDCHPEKYFA